MKKLLTALLLSVICAVCVFAFAACKDDDENTEFTEEDWKAAFAYYTVGWDEENYAPVKSDNPRANFGCTKYVSGRNDREAYSYQMKFVLNFDDLKIYSEYSEENTLKGKECMWKDGDEYYSASDGENYYTDEETDEIVYYYSKDKLAKDEFLSYFDTCIYVYAGGEHILAMGLADKFNEFTYSEEKEEYTATFYNKTYQANADVTVKIQGGRLVNLTVYVAECEFGSNISESFVYTYAEADTAVTVPELFLNLEVGRTPKVN